MENCKICNNEFKNFRSLGLHIIQKHMSIQEYYDRYLKNENDGFCKTCNKATRFINLNKGYKKYCSIKCAHNNNEIKQKIKETNLKRYGVSCTFNDLTTQNKIKETNFKKYGAENPFNSNILKERMKTKKFNNWLLMFDENLNKVDLKILNKTLEDFTLQCLKCNNIFTFATSTVYNYLRFNIGICPHCNQRWCGSSNQEKLLLDYIKSIYNGTISENNHSILKRQELDIYLPDLKIAFEYNGLYWHSTMKCDINYHLNKTIECEKQGIQLVHIFENEWIENQTEIKKYIKDLINDNVDVNNYNIIFKKINDNIIVDRSLNNGKILEKEGYVLTETIKPKNKNITYKNKNYEIYDCGSLIYGKV